MYKTIALAFILLPLALNAQPKNRNPFVSGGTIDPSPLLNVESGGTGILTFSMGNSGTDPLDSMPNQRMLLTIELSNIAPETSGTTPEGTAAGYFTWSYSKGTYTGRQSQVIPAGFTGTITLSFSVTGNSSQDNPQNGFSAQITPGPYRNSNVASDDLISINTWTECVVPQPPSPGTVTQPTCQTATGSVILNDLPLQGTWTVTRSPGGTTVTGTGSSVTVSGLQPGTYTFTVTAGGCTSPSSSQVVINPPPDAPPAPVIVSVEQPSCTLNTGSIVLGGLPAGQWILRRSPGNVTINGSGGNYTDSGLADGAYTYTITNSQGCTSGASERVTILQSPALTTQPDQRIDCLLGTGFAIITVTRPLGIGLEYRLDEGSFQSSPIFAGVGNGSHVITVRNQSNCTITGNPFSVACGCVNRPTVNLSSQSGSTCGLAPVTVTGNSFGGSATAVTLSEDGAGSVSPVTVTSTPFTFTYTPAAGDIGRTITITLTTNNPLGSPCAEDVETYSLTVSAIPAAPVIGSITQPSCTTSTGNVVLTGLPGGNWIIRRTPGNVSINGSGASTTITGLSPGTYFFTVSVSGCDSEASAAVVINEQPPVAGRPHAGTIVHPTCSVPTGSITITGLPASGTWTLTRLPGNVSISGTGTSTTIPALQPGTYNFTVTPAVGCTSPLSANMVINQQPVTPEAPIPGAITAPTCAAPLGSVILSGLPRSGNWVITRLPGGVATNGNGITTLVTGLPSGTYRFTVTNAAGCISEESTPVVIPQMPDAPLLIINDPLPVCAPATINLTAPYVTAGSSPGIILTYWLNLQATQPLQNPASVGNGVYYIKGTNPAGCYSIRPVTATVRNQPVAISGEDQTLEFVFETHINANIPAEGETGTWSVSEGTGTFANASMHSTSVSDLSIGQNVLLWTVTNGVCQPATDSLVITVKDLTVPTLITPNNDGRNDLLIMRGIESIPDNELVIFDRRGVKVFEDHDYRNTWDGRDYHGKPLPDDTYFYVLKTGNGRNRAGYIVIRR